MEIANTGLILYEIHSTNPAKKLFCFPTLASQITYMYLRNLLMITIDGL